VFTARLRDYFGLKISAAGISIKGVNNVNRMVGIS
jgi:hypothetical protein